MAKTIWKFEIPVAGRFELMMPRNAQLLFIATQRNRGCLWAVVDPENIPYKRTFRLYGTGHPVDTEGAHVGSFQMVGTLGEGLVFHVFEERATSEQDRLKAQYA